MNSVLALGPAVLATNAVTLRPYLLLRALREPPGRGQNAEHTEIVTISMTALEVVPCTCKGQRFYPSGVDLVVSLCLSRNGAAANIIIRFVYVWYVLPFFLACVAI